MLSSFFHGNLKILNYYIIKFIIKLLYKILKLLYKI